MVGRNSEIGQKISDKSTTFAASYSDVKSGDVLPLESWLHASEMMTRAVWCESITYGSVRGLGWNSPYLLDRALKHFVHREKRRLLWFGVWSLGWDVLWYCLSESESSADWENPYRLTFLRCHPTPFLQLWTASLLSVFQLPGVLSPGLLLCFPEHGLLSAWELPFSSCYGV